MATDWPVYPLFLLLAVVAGCLCGGRLLRDLGVETGSAVILLLVGGLAAAVGAKLFSVFERGGLVWWDPWWEMVHGYRYPGAILALVAVAPFLPGGVGVGRIGDVLAVTTPVSMVFVRTGCFLAGCCHGVPTDGWWGVSFPANSPAWVSHVERGWIAVGAPSSLTVHPLQGYFATTSLAVALILFKYRRSQRRAGQTFFLFLLLDGVLKLLFEQLRLGYREPLAICAAVFAGVGAVGLALTTRLGGRTGADLVRIPGRR